MRDADRGTQPLMPPIGWGGGRHSGQLLAEGSPEAIAVNLRVRTVDLAGNDEHAFSPETSESDGSGGDAP
ncbi:MAG: hypothetical protein ABEK03_03630 [Candidatus Bipolaricaulia bacterium]